MPTDFSEGGTPCQTLANSTDTKPGFLDLKVTESNLANFFGAVPGFSSVPAIDTHARVEIQAVKQENNIRPIAVRDDAAYLCAQAQLWVADQSGSPSALLTTIALPSRTVLPDGSTRFQNPAGSPPIPLAQNISVRILLGNLGCATTDAFADPSGGVNSWPTCSCYPQSGRPTAGGWRRVTTSPSSRCRASTPRGGWRRWLPGCATGRGSTRASRGTR